MSKTARFALLIAALCVPAPARAAAMPADFGAKVDAVVQRELQRQHVPGIEVGIALEGSVVLRRGYGTRDVQQSLPVDERTVFAFGSITKTFTAAGVMKLVDEHRIDLDAKVQAYVPDAPHASELTVRNLLVQTSGLADYIDAQDLAKVATPPDIAPAQLVAPIADEPLGFIPGAHYAYSNTNYLLLTAVLERASGVAYPDYLRSGFIGPLHLETLSYGKPATSDVALGNGGVDTEPEWSAALSRGAGALWGSAADLLGLDDAFFAGRLVSAETVRRMTAKQPLRDGSLSEYGFGWMVSEIGGHRAIWHDGLVPGFHARNVVFPDDRLAIAVLGNRSSFDEEPIVRAVLALIDPASESVQAPAPEPPADDPVLNGLARAVLASVQAGALDRTAYTADANAAFTDALIRRVGAQLEPLGAPASVTLIYHSYVSNISQVVYRLVFRNAAVLERLDLDAHGKIAGLLFTPSARL